MAKRVLFMCAHNQSRSVTAEGLLTGEQGYIVKSRALWKGYARRVTPKEGKWADEAYVMMPGMIPVAIEAGVPAQKLKALWIPDKYVACETNLILELAKQLRAYGIHVRKGLNKAKVDCEKVWDRKMGAGKYGGLLGGLGGWDFGEEELMKKFKWDKETGHFVFQGKYEPPSVAEERAEQEDRIAIQQEREKLWAKEGKLFFPPREAVSGHVTRPKRVSEEELEEASDEEIKALVSPFKEENDWREKWRERQRKEEREREEAEAVKKGIGTYGLGEMWATA
jgi:predicted protein tyrosine phosphatase